MDGDQTVAMLRKEKYLELSLVDLLYAVVKWRRLVISLSFITLVLAIALAFLSRQYWVSRTTFMPILEDNKNISSQLNINLAGILSNNMLTTQKADVAVDYVTILESRSFREQLVRKFDLIRYFRIEQQDSLKAMDLALLDLSAKILRIRVEYQTGLITLSVETRDRYLSKKIADYCLTYLEQYNSQRKLFRSRLKREFLGQRLLEVKSQLDSYRKEEQVFLKKNKTVEIDLQTENVIKLYGELTASLFQNDLDLELAKQNSDYSSPRIAELLKKKEVLRSKIQELESENNNLFPLYILNLDKLPSLKEQYGRIKLYLNTAQSIYELVFSQYELAKVEELRDMPTLEIIDRPGLAGLYAKPQRLMLIIVSTLAAIILASLLVIVIEYISPEQKDRLKQIINTFKH